MSVIEVKYKRCKNCSCVYSDELDKCPNCGAESNIDEELNQEPVFNIND